MRLSRLTARSKVYFYYKFLFCLPQNTIIVKPLRGDSYTAFDYENLPIRIQFFRRRCKFYVYYFLHEQKVRLCLVRKPLVGFFYADGFKMYLKSFLCSSGRIGKIGLCSFAPHGFYFSSRICCPRPTCSRFSRLGTPAASS